MANCCISGYYTFLFFVFFNCLHKKSRYNV